MLVKDFSDCVGNTPVVRLDRFFDYSHSEVLAKLELMNPGGSVKDRPAKYIIEKLIESGKLIPNLHHVIESSSGNLAIALAMQCRRFNLQFTCVVDPKISPLNLKIIESLGANIDMVTEKDANGGYLDTRINRVQYLEQHVPNGYWVNQYANPMNWKSHYDGEGEELIKQLSTPVDYLVMGVSTSGTLLGISRRLKEAYPKMKVVAVDAVGSVLFNNKPSPRELPGIGASRVPALLKTDEIDQVIHVDDYESALACRKLVTKEGILAGGSSGSALAAVQKLLAQQKTPCRILTLLPDRGERYLDMVYDNVWVENARQRHLSSLQSSEVLKPTPPLPAKLPQIQPEALSH